MKSQILAFSDLKTWQKSHQLVLLIYSITTSFPNTERYSLTDQMRRAAISVTANIAEGFGRFSQKEKIHFYYIAQGSLMELHCFIFLVKDLKLVKNSVFQTLEEQVIESLKLLRGLIRFTKNKSEATKS